MLRLKRFRFLLALVAVAVLLAVYQSTRLSSWSGPAATVLKGLGSLHGTADQGLETTSSASSRPAPLPTRSPAALPASDADSPPGPFDFDLGTSAPAASAAAAEAAEPVETDANVITGDELLAQKPQADDAFAQEDYSRLEVPQRSPSKPKARWRPPMEHFPVKSVRPLPVGNAQPLPRIQHVFGSSESAAAKTERAKKQTAVREAFKHAWAGYKEYAYGHDELKPLSNASADPFNGWGATLVDALDTMWIMGLTDEFQDAVDMVAKIDFQTSLRKDIPLFETTIRYLGGLLAAYDISGQRYDVLLAKAVELADITIGAFDTPNRMPVPYYRWAPSYSSQPHRSTTHVVMAELGSLAIEFTRLSQLSRQPKYYDAIARVTDALQEWQMNTTYPGLWPVKLDASGCKKVHVDTILDPIDGLPRPPSTPGVGGEAQPSRRDSPLAKRQTYSLGARADSTYEYFPKMHALLGGLSDQYKAMYETAMQVVRSDFLFRPMTKDGADILFLAKKTVSPGAENAADREETVWEGSHLGCFAGGMVALGAKLFDIPADMDLAAKLTDACVWAYQSTPLGVMPELFELVPCQGPAACAWNETRWHDYLDPHLHDRFRAVDEFNAQQEALWAATDLDAPIDPPNDNDLASSSPPAVQKRRSLEGDNDATSATLFHPKVALSHDKYVAARIAEERLPPGYTAIESPEYKLRPEAIESVFVMYRLTGDQSWRDKGWKMFTAVERATRTPSGHATVSDVTSGLGHLKDTMESFWLAETLKYYYLLFSDESLVSLDEWVLNTEAHPVPIPRPGKSL
ncbi:hypothetical protein DV737_g5659, partial [Chaetothyriales sp. CBS 132003]